MNRKSFGTENIARICSVTRITVGDWMNKGMLPFSTTPGGHKRVWEKDLITFLKSYNIPLTQELQRSQVVNILIVEDEPDVMKLVSKVVKKICPAAVIHQAESGFEAGNKIANLLPSLVILDLLLPGIHGIEICRMIRQDKKLKEVKILAISGVNVKAGKQNALDAGADDFLAKPFQIKELEERIKKLIPGEICVQV